MRRAALAVLALPLVLAACGGGGKSGGTTTSASPMSAVTAAASKTAAAGSESMTLKANANAAGQQVALTGNGSFDTKKHVGSMHIEFNAGGVNAAIDEVMDGTSVYLKSPLFTSLLPGKKTWLKVDLKKAGASQGLDISALMSQDPAESLKALQSLKGATKVGEETLPSGKATHYRATIDAAKLPAAAGVGGGTYDVWIGDDGYVHRVRTTISSSAGGQKTSATVVIDLADFGKAVSVTVPPASDTLDAGGSIPGLGG